MLQFVNSGTIYAQSITGTWSSDAINQRSATSPLVYSYQLQLIQSGDSVFGVQFINMELHGTFIVAVKGTYKNNQLTLKNVKTIEKKFIDIKLLVPEIFKYDLQIPQSGTLVFSGTKQTFEEPQKKKYKSIFRKQYINTFSTTTSISFSKQTDTIPEKTRHTIATFFKKQFETTVPIVNKPIPTKEKSIDIVIKKLLLIDSNWYSYKNQIAAAPIHSTLYLLDYSNSMAEDEKIQSLKTAITYLTTVLKKEDNYSIALFSDSVKFVYDNSTLHDTANLAKILDEEKNYGGTNINPALDESYKHFEKIIYKKQINKIVLLTDGEFTIEKPIIKKIEANAINGVSLSIILINFFDEKTKKYVQNICKLGKGNFYELRQENLIPSLVEEATK